MFAEKAYSPHGDLLMFAMILCVVSGAVLLSSAGAKLYRRPLYWLAAGSLFFLIVFAAIRYMLLIAPTQIVFELYLDLQAIIGVASVVVPFMMLIALIIQEHSLAISAGMSIISLLNIAATSSVLRTNPVSITDFFPITSFFVFSSFYCWYSKKLFPELAVMPEVLLEESNDLILVFDGHSRLMRTSPNCAEVFRIHKNMMREEFDIMFNETATIRADKTVSLAAAYGMKYYQFSETSVKTLGGTPHATVLLFSDVTEITELKAKLNEKNEETEALNVQLETYIKTSEKLEVEKQKEIAVRELEQAIGSKLECLTKEIESADAPQNLTGLIEACRDIMAGVRQAVFRLAKKEVSNERND